MKTRKEACFFEPTCELINKILVVDEIKISSSPSPAKRARYMRNYELIYLSSPDLSEEELNLLREKFFSLIQEVEGELLSGGSKADTSVRKKLASPIKNKDEAYFTTLSFRLEPGKLENLEKKLKLENQILRYLIFVKPKPEKLFEPKPPQILPRKTFESKPKVELKEIEKKLEEILDE